MDMSNWRPMECGDWRSQLQAAARQKIVNTITNLLKRHVTLSGHEVQYVIEKTAVGFEELIYTTATSQVDYLQKISCKMQKFQTRSQNLIPTANSVNPSHPGSQVTRQVNSQGQPHPIPVPSNHPQPGQQLLPHIMHNNMSSTGIQVGDSSIKSGDWRDQLQANSRQWNVNTIMGILKRHLPFSGHEMLHELEKIALRLEEQTFTAATSQYDYTQKICMKMANLSARSKLLVPDAMQSNFGGNSVNHSDSGSQVMQLLSQFMHNIALTGMQAIDDSSMESGDWRDKLQADTRQWIVNKIMDTLKRYLPFSGDEMVQELEKSAVRFEEKIYIAATSQSDYMRKIFLKIPTMETRSQYPVPLAMQSNSGANNINPSDPGFQVTQHVNSQAIGNYSMESVYWRAELQADSRQKFVNKTLDILKRHVLLRGHQGLEQLKKLAVKFEENIYTSATSQSDYMQKISAKLLTMETKFQNPMPDAMQSNSGSNVTQQMSSQGQPLPVPVPSNHPQPGQQLVSQTMHNNFISTECQAIGNSSMESGDWRAQLQPESRQTIVNKMTDALKRHPLFSGHEGLQELEKIAERFEETIYNAATSQSDYLRKISLKMLTMETRSQNHMPDATQSNAGANSLNPSNGVSG